MGSGRWEPTEWATYSSTVRSTKPTVDHVFAKREIHEDLNPKNIGTRESRDSILNPNSTPLIVALDVTGSMDPVLDAIAREGLGTLIQGIYSRKPITDPHVMLMGIGDVECDRSPLQATQFEAAVEPLTKQMEQLYLERGGGGNSYESYALAWLFAALSTSTDAWEKRKKKGYLFTVGDECPTPRLIANQVSQFLREPLQSDLTGRQILDMATQRWEVFHVFIEQGNYGRNHGDWVRGEWTKLLGQRFLPLDDHQKLAETIVSAIQVTEGASAETVAASWDGSTSVTVQRAIKDLAPAQQAAAGGLVKL